MISKIALSLGRIALAAALLLGQANGSPGHADQQILSRIEAHLNAIRSLRATFIQTTSTGGLAEGTLYLQRPRQLRLDYKPPTSLQIYADGYWLVYVDTELEEVTHVPLNQTPAYFLVRENIALSGDVRVTRLERGARTVRIHVVQTDEPDAGELVMTFADDPLRLQRWSVLDAQGVETQVTLIGPVYNTKIADDVFRFDEDSFDKPDYRQ